MLCRPSINLKTLCLAASIGLISAPVGCSTQPAEQDEAYLLHVPSPDWRDQIIYQVFIDRFNDGDPSNNDQGANVYDPTKKSHFSGGDLQGITDKLDYVQELGATAIWITPPIANLWWDSRIGYGGYHGYWPRNFKQVDEHFGTLDDYKRLSDGLHRRDMYLIHDVIVNHTADYFNYVGGYDADDPAAFFEFNGHTAPSTGPTQAPFDMNDARNAKHREANIYRWTPLLDYTDRENQWFHQVADLDDLNTENPVVREALKDSYRYWIEEVGIDGIRIDTVRYVEHDFWTDFIHAEDGLLAAASGVGRDNFFVTGEAKEPLPLTPYSTSAEADIAAYLSTEDSPQLMSAIGFPLHEELNRVLAGGQPTSYLRHRIETHMSVYPDPHHITNFINNHDVPRFEPAGSRDAMKQALALIMTLPGIPIIYQGDEQGQTDSRQAMFEGGYGAERDYFDTSSDLFQFTRELIALRKSSPVFSRGTYESLVDNPIGSGAFAFKRTYEGEEIFAVFNTADHMTLANALPTGAEQAVTLTPIFTTSSETSDIQSDEAGNVTLALPPRSIMILRVGREVDMIEAQTEEFQLSLDENPSGRVLTDALTISGTSSLPAAELWLVLDGNLDRATPFNADDNGRWTAILPVEDLGLKTHSAEIYAPQFNQASERILYQTSREDPAWKAAVTDPLGDDFGPTGSYTPPREAGFDEAMDITGITARSAGSVLEVDFKMAAVSDGWLPSFGFDRVNFSIFFDVPDQRGGTDLPFISAQAPEGSDWDFAHFAFGWGNALGKYDATSSEDALVPASGVPDISVDKANKTIRFTYSSIPFGRSSWDGVSLYATTWDKTGEGAYRTLSEEGGQWIFGGGSKDDPKILDDAIIVFPDPN